MRIYRVVFEVSQAGKWQRNQFYRDVATNGGAESAIREAMNKVKEDDDRKIRAEQVEILAETN